MFGSKGSRHTCVLRIVPCHPRSPFHLALCLGTEPIRTASSWAPWLLTSNCDWPRTGTAWNKQVEGRKGGCILAPSLWVCWLQGWVPKVKATAPVCTPIYVCQWVQITLPQPNPFRPKSKNAFPLGVTFGYFTIPLWVFLTLPTPLWRVSSLKALLVPLLTLQCSLPGLWVIHS